MLFHFLINMTTKKCIKHERISKYPLHNRTNVVCVEQIILSFTEGKLENKYLKNSLRKINIFGRISSSTELPSTGFISKIVMYIIRQHSEPDDALLLFFSKIRNPMKTTITNHFNGKLGIYQKTCQVVLF